MKAMILAAGKGTRLQPLTKTCPKPLLKVGGKPLIVYHLENLKKAGFNEIIINVHHLGEQIIEALGEGEQWGLTICYSKESDLLETGGGICTALPLLGTEPFVLVNGDVWTDYDFAQLPRAIKSLAYLILTDNPEHNRRGDFTINSSQILNRAGAPLETTYTYTGIAVINPNLFQGCKINQAFKLSNLFDKACAQRLLEGEYYSGKWTDVGDLARLQALDKTLAVSVS